MFDVNKIRKDFPILERTVNGQPLIYFDNAATSQTPNQVIDVISDYYQNYNSNIHRGVHTLATKATEALEKATPARVDPSIIASRASLLLPSLKTVRKFGAINFIACKACKSL